MTESEYTPSQVMRFFYRKGGGASSNRPPDARSISVQLELRPSQSMKQALEARKFLFGKYVLTREADLPYSKTFPTQKDLTLHEMILDMPNQRACPDAQGVLDQFFLPASTSSFFMFHGDRIRSLTREITEPVANSIRKILDVTAMNNAADDLESVRDSFVRKVDATKNSEKELKEKKEALARVDQRLEDVRKKIKDKKDSLALVEKNLSATTKQLKKMMEAVGLRGDFEKTEEKIKNDDAVLEAVNDQIRGTVDSFIRESLHHILVGHANQAKKTDEENQEHKSKIREWVSEAERLEHLKLGEKCPTCMQPLVKDSLDEVKEKVQHVKNLVEKESGLIVELDPQYVQLLRGVSTLEADRYEPAELEARQFQVRREITDLKNKLEDIKDKLEAFGEKAAKADELRDLENTLQLQKGRLLEAIEAEEDSLARIKGDRDKLNELIIGLQTTKMGQRAQRCARTSDQLYNAFNEAVKELALEKRNEISRETANMLLQTTIKPELFSKEGTVVIDEDFQVHVKNYEGNELVWDIASSSERSMLAVAFIYGLLKASERDSAIILDTFFGNLDPNHIRNISKVLPDFGPQVILMTTLGEFESLKSRADPQFWASVGKLYLLRNDGSTGFETQVESFDEVDGVSKAVQAQLQQMKRK